MRFTTKKNFSVFFSIFIFRDIFSVSTYYAVKYQVNVAFDNRRVFDIVKLSYYSWLPEYQMRACLNYIDKHIHFIINNHFFPL